MKLPKIKSPKAAFLIAILFLATSVAFLFITTRYQETRSEVSMLEIMSMDLGSENETLKTELAENLMKLNKLESEDQYQINKELQSRINSIETTYKKAVSTYEDLLKLKENSKDTKEFDQEFTNAIVALANQDYEGANTKLTSLSADIASEQAAIVASFTIPANVPESNSAPGSGYSRQTVGTEIGQYLVSLVAGDLSSTRVVVDTASDGTCTDNCPVLPLATYVSRNGAYAGINGSYFCPADYPSCAGKTNSFDTLLMNKNKTYFNSDNNVYSNVPAVIFGGSYIRFVGASSEWGRDTGIDSMIANQPLLVSGGNVVFGGDGDPKKGSKAGRSFVANKGNTVYIGVVHSATVAESAIALKALGMENALNLDSGGSTALWSGGYKVGPGRNLPNVILFVGK
jgi:hypothetical protein